MHGGHNNVQRTNAHLRSGQFIDVVSPWHHQVLGHPASDPQPIEHVQSGLPIEVADVTICTSGAALLVVQFGRCVDWIVIDSEALNAPCH